LPTRGRSDQKSAAKEIVYGRLCGSVFYELVFLLMFCGSDLPAQFFDLTYQYTPDGAAVINSTEHEHAAEQE
jgi:hypothetical protein